MNYTALAVTVSSFTATLAIIVWVAFLEFRVRKLSARLLYSDEKVKDDEITVQVHNLSDADLDSKMSDFLGRGDKPKT